LRNEVYMTKATDVMDVDLARLAAHIRVVGVPDWRRL
jgi:hypothetical protein